MKDKKNKKKIYVSAIVAALLGGALVNVVNFTTFVNAWGPERQTWTMANPADYATFNSITDNSSIGDEREFVRVAEAVNEGSSTALGEIHVQGGKDYVVTIYYHNDAASIYNKVDYNYKGVAQKTRLSVAFPDSLEAGEKGQVDALIYSLTANPEEVWDEAFLIADEKVKLSYITGSAKIYNDWALSGSEVNSAELFSADGTYLGVKEFNGLIPGCAEYSGMVVFRIHAESVAEPTSTFEMDKKVSVDGGATWVDNVTMNMGQEAEFRITYRNTGNMTQSITVFDTLENGKGMEYVPGSARIVANGAETIVRDEDGGDLFKSGVVVGEIKAGETAEIYYKVKISEGDAIACGKTLMYNLAGVSSTPVAADGTAAGGVATQHDKVQVEVNRNDNKCLPSELPSTGPAEMVLAGIIIAGLIVGVFYYVNSKRTLKKMQQESLGGPLDKTPEM
ncbi:DUF11 domain-containing protein [Candidatus Saccharibacteria bacterium]|nr:DUF11 domain-containing protein [Candidatus Saccharibacteria bacterium]